MKSWKIDEENDYIALYKIIYNELTLVTIRGVGYMVP